MITQRRLELSLREARLKKGVSQKELADSLGFSPQFVCNLERNGKIGYPVSSFRGLAKKLKMDISELVKLRLIDTEESILKELKLRKQER